jgi:prevent-host-death family protein
MNFLQFTDFRNKSKEYFDKVEHGSSFVIIRKGKPVAKLIPFNENETGPGWKRENKRVVLKSGKPTLDYILEERKYK